jgi:dipeptidyl aminopeptidase/acylaminoacyl peptidase
MLMMRVVFSLFAVAVMATGIPAAEPSAAAPSIEALFQDPQVTDAKVSPDGNRLALVTQIKGVQRIVLMDVASGQLEPIVEFSKDEIAHRTVHWKTDTLIGYAGGFIVNRYTFERRGGWTYPTAVHFYDLKAKRIIESGDGSRFVVDWCDDDPQGVLLGDLWAWSIFKRNIYTRVETSIAAPLRIDFGSAEFDHAGTVRARIRRGDNEVITEVRSGPSSEWSAVRTDPVYTALFSEAKAWQVLGFTADNTMYALTRGDDNSTSVGRYNDGSRGLDSETARIVNGTVVDAIFSRDQRVLQGVRIEGDRPTQQWFDQSRERLQAAVDCVLPTTFNRIVDLSSDGNVYTVAAYADTEPPSWYVFNRRNGSMHPIYHPTVAGLCAMMPIEYKARDGLTVHGYLTRPAGSDRKPVPLVVLVHNGPYGERATWHFDPLVQFLATRGYAVLQPNFRGSGGYGRSFFLAGRGEYGGKMLDDIVDATRWAVERAIADPKHMAIGGKGYGGFAALRLAIENPELYCCAIDDDGIPDLENYCKIIDSNASEATAVYVTSWIGNNRQQHAWSPLWSIDRLKIPTLHFSCSMNQSTADYWWRDLKRALDKAHCTYDYVKLDSPYVAESDRPDWYRKMEAFLAKNLAQKARAD